MKKEYWSKQQVKFFVKQVRNYVRDGWRFMTPETQRAYIEAHAFSIIRGQVKDVVEVAAMDELVSRMLELAGLEDV